MIPSPVNCTGKCPPTSPRGRWSEVRAAQFLRNGLEREVSTVGMWRAGDMIFRVPVYITEFMVRQLNRWSRVLVKNRCLRRWSFLDTFEGQAGCKKDKS